MKIRGNTVGTTMRPEKIADRIGGSGGGLTANDVRDIVDEIANKEGYIGRNAFSAAFDEEFFPAFYNELYHVLTAPSDEGGVLDIITEGVITSLPVYDGEVVE